MKLHYLINVLPFVIVGSASALPNLSEPTDIDVVNKLNSILEITNTKDNSILECELVADKLQGCKSVNVDGLVAPYRLAAMEGYTDTPRVYVTQKDSSNIFSYTVAGQGRILPNTVADKVPLSPFDSGSILEFSHSHSPYNLGRDSQRFFLSIASPDSKNSYGRFESILLNLNAPKLDGWQSFSNINLPFFFLEYNGHGNLESIVGAGHINGDLSEKDLLYPFSGVLKGANGSFITAKNMGGNDEDEQVKAALTPDVNSIAHFDGKYWVTYKSNKQFSRFDDYPTKSMVPPNTYQAPSNANVRLKTVAFSSIEKEVQKNFAVFSDDNKIGICSGDSDFTCTDAFRYLDVLLAKNGNDDTPETSYTAQHLSDSGYITFRNLNYSPLTSDEITSDFTIPDDVKAAFSGTCLDKIDFAPKEPEEDAGNDTCTLSFDFTKLSNLPPITESFDVGFTVKGPFGDVPTKFHFNLNLPTSAPHLEFQMDEQWVSQLNVNAGDTESFTIIYRSNNDQKVNPQEKLSFLNGNDNSATFRGYFADTGCLSANPPQLGANDSCTLTLRVPADASNQLFTLKLANPDNVPVQDNTLAVNVASLGNIIAHSPYGNQSIETISPIHTIDIQPGIETTVRFTNVGAADAHNFIVNFAQPKQHIPLVLSGECSKNSDLQALGGYCDLNIKLEKSDTTYGRFDLQVLADDITDYSIPITLGGFPIEQGLGVIDSQTGFVGTTNIYKGVTGALKVTNYTGNKSQLLVSLPYHNTTDPANTPHLGLFKNISLDPKIKSCLGGDNQGTDYTLALEPLESCEVAYSLDSGVNIEPQRAFIDFLYTVGDRTKPLMLEQELHFTNQDAVSVSLAHTDTSLDKLTLDASVPETTLIFTNNLEKTITGLNVSVTADNSLITQNSCQSKTLPPEQVCSITLTLNDEHPLLGNYQLKVKADNINERDIPLAIEQAQTDAVEVDNKGGYSMSVDYINYHPNSDGSDGQCQSGACYGKTSTGWFTNPYNTQITGVSGRQLQMYMMAGTSVSLPSCDGGKVVCTGTTLSPSCVYYGDGTDKATPQNQCLKYNP